MEFNEKFGEWVEDAKDQDDYHHWNNAEDLERLNWNQNSDCAVPGYVINCQTPEMNERFAQVEPNNCPYIYNFPGPASRLGVPGSQKNPTNIYLALR